MKRVLVVLAGMLVALVVGVAPGHAAVHSGPEAYAKGDGQLSTSQVTSTRFVNRTVCKGDIFGIPLCFTGDVAIESETSNTTQSFSFSAKRGPKTSATDPTDGAFGKMTLTTTSTVTSSIAPSVYYSLCGNEEGDTINGYVVGGCPPLTEPTTSAPRRATATAEVTCLNVVQNRAVIGGHVTKFSGDYAPTRGLLFNATDNTVARQQAAPDQFLGTFVADVPQTCPDPAVDAPISSGDVYVQQG